jgi:FtsH ternary system domain X5
MSRAYRIAVTESLSRTIHAKDCVSTQLEILEVLAPEEMAGLLAQELEKGGFEQHDGVLVRQQNGVTVTVDPTSGTVTVQTEGSDKVDLETERVGRAYDQAGPHAAAAKKSLTEQARTELERQAQQEEEKLQSQVTDRLERELAGLRQELDKAVNRATAEALKQKAARMGQIKEMSEDPESGSLTIVVEV